MPWHVVNLFSNEVCLIPMNHLSNFILQAVMSKAHGCNVVMSLSSLLYDWKTAVDALKAFWDGQMEQKLCIIISLIETFGLIEMVR